ncbi:MAG: pyruvate ferredoxin/flavodoxin oxidoreductase [Acidimicrobiia bacterium]
MSTASYELADRFVAETGTVFLSGLQALARVPIDQLRADHRDGLRTAAFVAGYPGSPLGMFDVTVRSAARLVADLAIECRPAVNEESAATAVMGSQLVATFPDRRYDGVVGIWYGKAPGVDRALDALRHASYAGTARTGGAVAFVGDDPNAKSSTLPSSSAGVLSDLHMPMLYPADPAEVLDLGRHAIALSRASGLWAALKIVADVADGTASVELHPERVRPVLPEVPGLPRPRDPEGRLLTPLSLDLERELVEVRAVLATEYAAVNDLNRVTVDPPDAWIGIVTSGVTSRELHEAFRRLGCPDDDAIAALGIRLLRMRMPLPFHPATVRAFARGLDEVVVIEEKQPNIELLVKDALYGTAGAPRVLGKHDESGHRLTPDYGSLDADRIVPVLRARLDARVGHRLAAPARPKAAITVTAVARTPFYCSGCPHNRSTTVVPDGALVGAGIGCHTMALLMDPERVGDISAVTCMGNEGSQWIGMAPFLEREHMFQNLGDGTYFHSGQLAVTAAIAAGVNITYKLLHNRAVAMTGGQLPAGQRSVASVAHTLLHQGVSEVLVTTDDVRAYRRAGLPKSVRVWHRDRLLEAQEHLATVPGVTVLIHDQACAAELRRARKRGLAPTPARRVVINHRVCEGCGDCGDVSNCLSVQPFDTPFGRKTLIDQTTCNFDYSCLEGDCPAFVTIDTSPRPWRRSARHGDQRGTRRGGRPGAARARGDRLDATPTTSAVAADPTLAALLGSDLPAPAGAAHPDDDVTVRMVGIGGTGVVTVAQVLGTAAMLDGARVRGLDQIGLSQKAGPVVSDLHFTRGHDTPSSRLGTDQADVLLVFDPLVAVSNLGVAPSNPERTVLVGSSSLTPPGATVAHPDLALPPFAELEAALATVTRPDHRYWVDADAVTTAAFGDALTANVLVAGMAVQSGALPVDPASVERAIELNGTAVEANRAAFRLGRHLVADPERTHAVLDALDHDLVRTPSVPEALEPRIRALALGPEAGGEVAAFTAELVSYQDERYASRYLGTLERVRAREAAAVPESDALTLAVARGLFKLMAYKDEYEVARLLLDEDAQRDIADVAHGRVRYHLHPPVLRALGMKRKIALGAWSEPGLRALARGKRLRSTVLDPFRWTRVRRTERALPDEYVAALDRVLAALDSDSLTTAIALAETPDLVRGYEDLKLRRVAEFRDRLAALSTVGRSTPSVSGHAEMEPA